MKTLDVLPACATPQEGFVCRNHIANASYRKQHEGTFHRNINYKSLFKWGLLKYGAYTVVVNPQVLFTI
jgi:hypothetical protein